MPLLEEAIEDLLDAVRRTWDVLSECEELDSAKLEQGLTLIEEWEDEQGWG